MPEQMNEVAYAKDWLEENERAIYMMLHRSSFYDQLYEWFLDLITVGTATMLIEEDPSTWIINYSTRHPKETYIMENAQNRVESAYREIWLTGQQALDRYGDSLPEKFVNDIMDTDDKKRIRKLADKHKFIHVIEPRHYRDSSSKLSKNKPFASVEYLPGTETILREGGYDEFPLVVARWSKNSNEKYGRSPAMDGISTIKRLNQEKYSTLRAAQLSVEPPLQVPVEMSRRLNLSPKGINTYKHPNNRVYPIDAGGRGYPFGRDMLEILRDEVNDVFMVPLFRMLDSLDRQVTAREVMERQGERVSSLSGPLTRQNAEGLGPMIMRTFNIMSRRKLLPQPPPALMQMGVALDIEFTGLLSQAQRKYHQAQSLNSGMAQIAGLVEISQNPAILDNLDLDDLVRKIAETEGFPASSVRELPEIKKLRAMREQAMAQAQQQEQMESAAGSLHKLSKAPEEGSPAEGILQGSGLV